LHVEQLLGVEGEERAQLRLGEAERGHDLVGRLRRLLEVGELEGGPLSMMARWNRPAALGMANSAETFPPPPDSPNIVTEPGSPPKLAMLSLTHSRTATQSSIPRLADSANSSPRSSPRYRNPKIPKRWLALTTTTSLRRARLAPL
jgi:hypothetical protein